MSSVATRKRAEALPRGLPATSHTTHDALPTDRPAPKSEPPATAAARLTLQNHSAEEIWRGVLDAMGSLNSAAWMDHFRLQSIMPGEATLAATIGFAGGVKNVATTPRLQRVAATLEQLLDQPFRVTVAERSTRPDPDDSNVHAAAPEAPRASQLDRRDVLNLPLVRDALDVFPDASVVQARREDDAN